MSKNLVITDLDATLPSITSELIETNWDKFLGAFKNKLQSLEDQLTDVMESLSPRVKKRVEALREIQSQHDEFEAKFLEERAALEAKYQKLYEPLYTKRYDIVNGLVEVEDFENENAEGTPPEDTATEEKGIPDFWLTAMKTNHVLVEEIQERDKEALKFLKDIKWCKIDNQKGFKLEFFFNANPFFKNSVLTKIYQMIDEEETTIEKAIIGTEIEWLPEKCLTQKLMEKKPRKGSNTKPITKTENCNSFFNFFNPPQVPGEDSDIDEETAEALQNEMDQHYEIGSTIRDKIIPHAVSWFTGEVVQDDFGMSENDEEDEEEESKMKMKSSGVAGAEVDHLPECKQQ